MKCYVALGTVEKGERCCFEARQDIQLETWQSNAPYVWIREFLDLALSEDNEGECFNSKGREFQHFGAIVLIECLSERITKKLFFAFRVLWPWLTLVNIEEITCGSIFLESLKENILMACSYKSSIFSALSLWKMGLRVKFDLRYRLSWLNSFEGWEAYF